MVNLSISLTDARVDKLMKIKKHLRQSTTSNTLAILIEDYDLE